MSYNFDVGYKNGFANGAASRDAEVAELKQDSADFRGQVNRLTEWNNNLVSHREELLEDSEQLSKDVILLRKALFCISNDYLDRFDMESPSTNLGIKLAVAEAIEALAATEHNDRS